MEILLMKKINGLVAGSLLLISNTGFAEESFCLSDNGPPTHCKAGDIILIGPKNVPLVCDFSKQIVQMSKKENVSEYVCSYTGIMRQVKKSPVKAAPPQRNNNPANYAPPPKKNKSMFGNMPFMK